MATASPAQQTALSHLYITLFDRAPDASGFAFWSEAIAQGASTDTLITAFLGSPESMALYPASQSGADFVTALYENVFERAPDADGLAFWTAVLDQAGGPSSMTARASLVSRLIEVVATPLAVQPAGLSDAQYADTVMDREIFAKKAMVGVYFADTLKSDDLVMARYILSNLGLRGSVAEEPAEATPVVPGQTFLLSTGGDTFTGGAGDDVFDAPAFGGFNSINTHDRLDGGDGIDTINIGLQYRYLEVPTLKNIEIVKVTTLNTDVLLDLRNSTGITHAGFTRGDAMSDGTLRNVGDAALFVSEQTANAAFSGSTASTLSLSLREVGAATRLTTVDLARTGDGAMATAHDIELRNAHVALTETVASAEVARVEITASGVNTLSLSDADAASVRSVSVTGRGSVDFSGQAFSALETFNAGNGGVTLASTGATALTLITGNGADTIAVNGASVRLLHVGGGKDMVQVDGALTAQARIELGAGNDTIVLSHGSANGATVNAGAGDDRIVTGAVSHAVPGVSAGSVDTLTGGAGADTFVFTTADVASMAGAVTAVITDFTSGIDRIVVEGAGAGAGRFAKAASAADSLADLLVAADAALDGSVRYYVGEVAGDGYLVTDVDGVGYTNVIKLVGVGMRGIVDGDIVVA